MGSDKLFCFQVCFPTLSFGVDKGVVVDLCRKNDLLNSTSNNSWACLKGK